MVLTVELLLVLTAFGLLFGAISMLISVLGGAQFVRTPARLYPLILKYADLTPGETFVEPGCGPGYLLEYIARQSGVRTHGIELSPGLYFLGLLRARRTPGMTIECRNMLSADYRKADAVYCYLLPQLLGKLHAKLSRELKPGSVLLSYAFPVPNVTPSNVIPRTPEFAPIYIYRL